MAELFAGHREATGSVGSGYVTYQERQQIKAASKTAELYSYPGDDHNIANSFRIAMQRSIQFFDKYVKQ